MYEYVRSAMQMMVEQLRDVENVNLEVADSIL